MSYTAPPPESQELLAQIHRMAPEMVAIRHQIHAHPELAFEEVQTSNLVASKLTEWGYQVERGLGGTGLVGQLRRGNGNRRIGLRADMDALPIVERTGLPYCSTVHGKMHACGHDGHTAILLCAAKYLAEQTDFNGTLNLIFQPAEENEGGALRMVQEGLFERYPCDQIYALHNSPGLPVGQMAMSAGPAMASFDRVTIELQGVSAHGAMPHHGVDPMQCAASKRTGAHFLHVPYKGSAPALQDLAGGQVDFAILAYQVSMDGMAQQGRLKVLTSFSKTLPANLKHLPSIEASKQLSDFEYVIGGGYLVRKDTPDELAARLRAAVGHALRQPDIRAKLEAEGRTVMQPVATQVEADAYLNLQVQRYGQLLKDIGRSPVR